MNENLLCTKVLDSCFTVHKGLGPGLLESVYKRILVYELRINGFEVEVEKPISLEWDDIRIDNCHRADLVVENKLVIELKSVSRVQDVHKKQLLTYLRLLDMRLGILVNFNEALLKDGISRVANRL